MIYFVFHGKMIDCHIILILDQNKTSEDQQAYLLQASEAFLYCLFKLFKVKGENSHILGVLISVTFTVVSVSWQTYFALTKSHSCKDTNS